LCSDIANYAQVLATIAAGSVSLVVATSLIVSGIDGLGNFSVLVIDSAYSNQEVYQTAGRLLRGTRDIATHNHAPPALAAVDLGAYQLVGALPMTYVCAR
jgi:superfamily II DNA or RNA helicase